MLKLLTLTAVLLAGMAVPAEAVTRKAPCTFTSSRAYGTPVTHDVSRKSGPSVFDRSRSYRTTKTPCYRR